MIVKIVLLVEGVEPVVRLTEKLLSTPVKEIVGEVPAPNPEAIEGPVELLIKSFSQSTLPS